MPSSLYLRLKWLDFKLFNRGEFERLQSQRRIETSVKCSYKPFDDKRAIFVHIPKCAGISVSKAIFGNRAGSHTTLDQYLTIFEPRCIASYFKFTFVRNPWDRLVSAYSFLKNGGFHEQDRDWFHKELGAYSSFDDFIRSWLNKENIWKWQHFRPQYHYMLDRREKVPLDFVGFLENIEEDFAAITKHIGVDCRLPTLNPSRHSCYRDYYNDETRDIVAQVYEEDIRLLGYSFDNSSLPQQLCVRLAGNRYSLREPCP